MRKWVTAILVVVTILTACALVIGIQQFLRQREEYRVRLKVRSGLPGNPPVRHSVLGMRGIFPLSESQAASFRRIVSKEPRLMERPSERLPPLGFFVCGDLSYDWEGSWLTVTIENTKVTWEDPMLDDMMHVLAQARYSADPNTVRTYLAVLGPADGDAAPGTNSVDGRLGK